MDIDMILRHCDHTLLAQDATWDRIRRICDEGIEFGCASVCIPPAFVRRAKEYTWDALEICTVIGFPNGYNSTAVKVFETEDAVDAGADEIDMVINVGALKAGDTEYVENEIRAVRQACEGKILKVIIETCLLTDEEKVIMCGICARAGADYIKTSTGFAGGGATHEDVRLMKANCPEGLKIKAAGGIRDLEDAALYLEEGADRLGTSRIVKAAKELMR